MPAGNNYKRWKHL